MDLLGGLAELGRRLLVAVGLITLVNVGFEAAAWRQLAPDRGRLEVTLSGAVSGDLLVLVGNAVPVVLEVTATAYLPGGRRQAQTRRHSLAYRGLDRSFVVDSNGRESRHDDLGGAIAAVQRFTFEFEGVLPGSIVLRAVLRLPTIADPAAPGRLWQGRDPSLVFEPGRP
ncbi:MAG TPA: hypothetical protein DD477_03130 [Spirochaetaceae bacterium]|nr:hypothetical protein [Spirochaetaceae bacterium]